MLMFEFHGGCTGVFFLKKKKSGCLEEGTLPSLWIRVVARQTAHRIMSLVTVS